MICCMSSTCKVEVVQGDKQKEEEEDSLLCQGWIAFWNR